MKLIVAVLTVLAVAAAAPKQSKLGFKNLYHQPLKAIQSAPKPHIIGGQEAVPHSMPYIALLEIYDRNNGWYCGGALVSRNYVLSAATCIHANTWLVYIHLGLHTYLAHEETELELVTSYFSIHENYTGTNVLNDIALIRLPRTIDYNDVIQPIPLPKDPSRNYAGSLATVAGWGVRGSGANDYPESLQYITVAVITNEACENYYGPISSTLVCTGPDEGAGICSGDSGNPLVADGVLVGLAAFTGEGCEGQPIGYTRITKFLDWLKFNTDVDI